MEQKLDHVTVCICTYKRPEMLFRLISELLRQRTEGLFEYSILVVDNDHAKSAQPTVQSFRSSPIDVEYHTEPEQNIALARNRAVSNARGNLLALIDDDELPQDNWLRDLYKTRKRFDSDGVLGPVKPSFEGNPPAWLVKGQFYEKGHHKTGNVLHWQDTCTSNVLMKRSIFEGSESMFRKEFSKGGEDVDFFQRAINNGRVFVWCNEAPVHERIPRDRLSRRYMLRRAVLRGTQTPKYSNFTHSYTVKSILAVPTYALMLPFAFIMGQHHGMKLLSKLFEHIGRLLALAGVDVVKHYYPSNPAKRV